MVGSMERIHVAEEVLKPVFVDGVIMVQVKPQTVGWHRYSFEFDGATREVRVLRQRDDGAWEDVTDQATKAP